uniref:Uncharacterized protein n=1 Tax=Anguilla anguilla TaxID=7936 RepID=A0A0E9X5V2_ANGAN
MSLKELLNTAGMRPALCFNKHHNCVAGKLEAMFSLGPFQNDDSGTDAPYTLGIISPSAVIHTDCRVRSASGERLVRDGLRMPSFIHSVFSVLQ